MAKHTPGPWRAGSASVTAPETEDRLGLSVRIHGGNGGDNRANARLIAASPRMYEYIAKQADKGDQDAASIIDSI